MSERVSHESGEPVNARSRARQQPSTSRFASLDGLRGVAALVVVFHHLFLVLPQVAALGSGPTVGSAPVLGYTPTVSPPPVIGTLIWLYESTPIKIATAGSEAVLVFFVLSGMVVALPVMRKPGYDWISYFPRRVVRLYLPVLASIVFAAICILIHPQVLGPRMSAWLALDSVSKPTLGLFLGSTDVFLSDNVVNNPLWTLRWEIIFSLALPLFVAGAVLLRRRWVFVLAGAFVLVWIGSATGNGMLQFLPVFFVGTLLAANSERLSEWASKTRGVRYSGLAWLAVLLGGLSLLIIGWLVWPLVPGLTGVRQFVGAFEFLGALLIVAVCFLWQGAVGVLSIAPIRWLGRVSFSLYLVHVPIIYAVANFFGPGHWAEIVAVSLPLALIMSEIFTRLVERPAHVLSRRIGGAVSTRYRQMSALAVTPRDVDASSSGIRDSRDQLPRDSRLGDF